MDKSFLTWGMEKVLEWPNGVHEPSEIKTEFFFFCKYVHFFSGGGKGLSYFSSNFPSGLRSIKS